AVDELRQHDRATGVVDIGRDAYALERLLETGNVARAHVHHGACAAADGAGIHHFWHGGEDALQLFGGDGAPAEQLDVRLGGQPINHGVDLDGEPTDHLVGNERVDATFNCGCGEPDDLTDLPVTCAGVLPQQLDDSVIEIVHDPTLWRFVVYTPENTLI